MRPTGKIRPARFDCDTVPLLAPLRVAADFLLGVAIVNWRKRELQTTHQPASSITTPSAAPKPRSPTRRPRCVLEGFSVAFEKKKITDDDAAWGALIADCSPPRPRCASSARSVAVEHAAALLEGRHDGAGRHRALLRVLGVRGRARHDLLHEALEDPANFLINQTRQPLDTLAAREAANGALGDASDIVLEDLLHALARSALALA